MIVATRAFEVLSIGLEDLRSLGLSQFDLELLTNDDMVAIAARMAALSMDNGYWQDLETVVYQHLADRKKEAHG